MKLLQKPETLCLVLVYFFGSLNHVLCCLESLATFPDKGYATFQFPVRAADIINTTVVLAVQDFSNDDNSGYLELAEGVKDAQRTLENTGIIKYRIILPRSNAIPSVVEISTNYTKFCSIDRKEASTTITLSHTFKTHGLDGKTTVRPTNLPPSSRPIEFVSAPPPSVSDEITEEDETYVEEDNVMPQIPEKIPTEHYDASCGQISKDLPLIYKGKAVSKGDWPWLAALFHSESGGISEFKCGGTVVSRTAIVTAAHCFDESRRPREYFVAVGRHNVNKLSEGQTLEVFEIHRHTSYKSVADFDANIAIVITEDKIRYSDYVRPACVWLTETTGFTDIVGENGIVVGWGMTEKGKLNDEPLSVTVPIISKNACESFHPKLKSLNTARGFCAGKLDGSGPCTGDSGSGLLVKYRYRWYLRGIVSQKIDVEKCSDRSYVFYTDVAQFTKWINDNKD